MARLPSEEWLIQQIGDDKVILFHEGTEEEVVRFDPRDANAVAQAQKVIFGYHRMTDEDKAFAHFWCGYFYALAVWQAPSEITGLQYPTEPPTFLGSTS
jgi:hypothetical protein